MNFLFVALIFVASFLISTLPKIISKVVVTGKKFSYVVAISSGVMLSVLLIEFAPHVLKTVNDSNLGKHIHHPITEDHDHHANTEEHNHTSLLGLFIAGITFSVLTIIDSLIPNHSHEHSATNQSSNNNENILLDTTTPDKQNKPPKKGFKQAMMLIMAMSIHSILEGLVFVSNNSKGVWFGILIHKILESFTLGVTLADSEISQVTNIALCLFFSMLTPIGMMLSVLGTVNGHLEIVFNGLAFGSTLYVVCMEMMLPIFMIAATKTVKILKGVCLIFGFIATSTVFKLVEENLNH